MYLDHRPIHLAVACLAGRGRFHTRRWDYSSSGEAPVITRQLRKTDLDST
jgi:hypothetical protein